MLDPARHFIPLDEVKRFIDLMARFKFNVLQLHLTISSSVFRNPFSFISARQRGHTPQFFSITASSPPREIVPELDIPGHTAAAVYAYPYLGCQRSDTLPLVLGETTDRMLCAAEEGTYDFTNSFNSSCV